MIYFGGSEDYPVTSDRVVEYMNLEWTLLGNLAIPRYDNRSIKLENKIYIFGGSGGT